MISKALPSLRCVNLVTRYFNSNAQVEESTPAKTYRMPVQKKIELYKTEFPIRMHNSRVLLYLNKQRLTTPMLLQTPHAGAFSLLIYLIRNNPWYLTFPASLPIMMGLQLYIFAKWIIHKRFYKYIVQRVYLYYGNIIEITFSNKIRRKIKDTEEFHHFNDPEELMTPPQNPDGSANWRQRGFHFPSTLVYRKIQETGQIECVPPMTPFYYGWTKYTNNYTQYIFPKSFEHANWQILVPLMNGRYIDLQNSTNQIHELPQGVEYPPAEQELKWIKADQQLNEQLRQERINQRKGLNAKK